MALQCGIVGLPNVGKSTLFNALTSARAEAANYPFCTIEPNKGIVKVPDPRLRKLEELVSPQKTLPAVVEFVDIAGLVKGASSGEGLGNKFLGHIKEVDAIVHVVRCFEDSDITHVHGKVDPLEDISVIETELILKDLETVENRVKKWNRGAKGKEKEEVDFYFRIKEMLEEGKWLSREEFTEEENAWLKGLCLISAKKVLYVANVEEDAIGLDLESSSEAVQTLAKKAEEEGNQWIAICSKIEAEIAELETLEERNEFLESLGLEESGLNILIRTAYQLLGLQTYFTAGEKEVRAWTIRKGFAAPQAAGVIHTDFEKGFIKAEVIAYDDYVRCGSEQSAKEQGLMRMEGKEYIVQDGDVVHFRFNV